MTCMMLVIVIQLQVPQILVSFFHDETFKTSLFFNIQFTCILMVLPLSLLNRPFFRGSDEATQKVMQAAAMSRSERSFQHVKHGRFVCSGFRILINHQFIPSSKQPHWSQARGRAAAWIARRRARCLEKFLVSFFYKMWFMKQTFFTRQSLSILLVIFAHI